MAVITYRDRALDQAIEAERALQRQADASQLMPSKNTRRNVEHYLCSTDLVYIPMKSVLDDSKMWKVKLPPSTGRTMRCGMTLVVTQRIDPFFEYMDGVRVHVSWWRRCLSRRFSGQTTSGLIWLIGGRASLEPFTKRVEN